MNSRIPEDSVLKRHHAASALSDILASMPARPTDSVLRRHFDGAVRQALAEAVGGDAAALLLGATTASSPAPSAPATPAPPAAAAAAAPAEPTSSGGGFFGWLKRLLGG